MELTDPGARAAEQLVSAFQHTFREPGLLYEALTHGSAGDEHGHNYERLEFLGDRVLSLVVAELLFRNFPDEAEGKLARRYTALVRREALAEVASTIGLGEHLVLSHGEDIAGGRDNPSLLADVCEAVIAALYLDGGLPVVENFIQRYWTPMMERSLKPPVDAKTDRGCRGFRLFGRRHRFEPPHGRTECRQGFTENNGCECLNHPPRVSASLRFSARRMPENRR